MPNPQELAVTLPLGVVEKLLELAMQYRWAMLPETIETIKLMDREVEEVEEDGEMSELITLQGGPLDGQMVDLEGGDYYYAAAYEPGYSHVGVVASDPIPNEPLQHLVYRRSEGTRTIFVFQP